MSIVVFKTVELVQSLPFELGDFNDGIRLAVHIAIGTICKIAWIIITIGMGCFPGEFTFIVMICQFVHEFIIT